MSDSRAVSLRRGRFALPLLALGALGIQLLLHWRGQPEWSRTFGLGALAVTAAPLLLHTARQGLRGNFATDAVAALSILTAIVLRQPLPGLIIVLMQSGGEALERVAQQRATRALAGLEAGAPRIAHRQESTGLRDVAVSELRVGDIVMVRPGEIIPTDGVVEDGRSQVDTAQITGEPMPVAAGPGHKLFSGYGNLSGPLTLRVSAVAAESQYERIVQLVRNAQASKAPLQRLADRYAVWFTPLTVLVAAVTYLLTRDADRLLAVLVVATPCPLILAAPVAIIGGMNCAARQSVIIRSGRALEQLGRVRAVVFDKTGTLTTGRPAVERLLVTDGRTEAELWSLVAAVEQGSGHTSARAILEHVAAHDIVPGTATGIQETSGAGVRGTVGTHEVAIGSEDYVRSLVSPNGRLLPAAGSYKLRSYIAVDGKLAGFIEFDDRLRPDLAELLAGLRADGSRWLAVLSGDDADTVRALAAQLDVNEAHGDLKPEDKLRHVQQLIRQYGPTLMIGDGVNDAPALAAATVGLAVTPRGGSIAAETADVVLLGDNLLRVRAAIRISRRTLHIARQSIAVGLGLSAAGMIAASLGWLTPVAGALFQEAIDVAVILNALRAAGPTGSHGTQTAA